MKKLKLLAMILCIGIIAASCTKEGPAGPQGLQGNKGADGTNGTNGNANVTVYGFSGPTFTTSVTSNYFTLPISSGMVDSSLILPYYLTIGNWYQVGEIGNSAQYATRYYVYPQWSSATLFVKILNVDGSSYTGSDVTWDSVKVFVIPANTFLIANHAKVDFSNYQSVLSYFSQN